MAIELSCHQNEKISCMAEEVEKKAESMAEVLKAYKKLVFKAEADLKKDHQKVSRLNFMFAAPSEF